MQFAHVNHMFCNMRIRMYTKYACFVTYKAYAACFMLRSSMCPVVYKTVQFCIDCVAIDGSREVTERWGSERSECQKSQGGITCCHMCWDFESLKRKFFRLAAKRPPPPRNETTFCSLILNSSVVISLRNYHTRASQEVHGRNLFL